MNSPPAFGDTSIRLYEQARLIGAEQVIIADTEVQFGLDRESGASSCRWSCPRLFALLARRRGLPAASPPASSKQYITISSPRESGWDKLGRSPRSSEGHRRDPRRFIEAFRRLTGEEPPAESNADGGVKRPRQTEGTPWERIIVGE